MKTVLVAFGDSWTFGSELDIPREDPWPTHLARLINAESVNMGVPASGIGHIVLQFFNFLKQEQYQTHKKVFMVGLSGATRYLSYSNQHDEFVDITTEAVYRTQHIHPSGGPPPTLNAEFNILSTETYKRVQHTTWDTFLAAQVIALIQNYCKNQNIKCYFFSYFDKIDFTQFDYILDQSTIQTQTITEVLTGKLYTQGVMDHPYFEGKLFHPNLNGHKQIAKILYDQCFSRP
jgi:hypothetical protein